MADVPSAERTTFYASVIFTRPTATGQESQTVELPRWWGKLSGDDKALAILAALGVPGAIIHSCLIGETVFT
jgi:hypothetical protein